MKIFAMQIKCDTAEELSQALRMAADDVIHNVPLYAGLATDEWLVVGGERDDVPRTELGRIE